MRARKILVGTPFFTVLVVMPLFADPFTWNEIKSDHFILSYQGENQTFADRLLRQAEAYYDDITDSLGYSRRDGFWLWDERCRIDLYASKEEFQKATGKSRWSSGFALLGQRRIVSYTSAPDLLGTVLPHEMAHLILRDFVGSGNGQIPLWLDEGVAMAQEKGKRLYFDSHIRKMVEGDAWIPMAKFSNIRSLQGMSSRDAALFYAQAQSLIRFLLAEFDSTRFVGLCRALRDGADLDTALRKNYPADFSSPGILEMRWLSFVRRN